jgi:hypothetical protein
MDQLSPRQERFLKRLDDSYQRLLNSIIDLDESTLSTAHIYDDWTPSDIFGHLVSWDNEFRADIAIILQGRHPGYERVISGDLDFSVWNLAQRAQKRTLSWSETLADFERDVVEARNLILTLTPKDYRQRGVTPWKRAALEKPAVPTTSDTESVETLISYHWRHWDQHTKWLERWRE